MIQGKKRFKFKCEFEISHFHSKFKFYKTDFGGSLDQGAFLVCLVAVLPCLARSRWPSLGVFLPTSAVLEGIGECMLSWLADATADAPGSIFLLRRVKFCVKRLVDSVDRSSRRGGVDRVVALLLPLTRLLSTRLLVAGVGVGGCAGGLRRLEEALEERDVPAWLEGGVCLKLHPSCIHGWFRISFTFSLHIDIR